jgi:glycine oxidase
MGLRGRRWAADRQNLIRVMPAQGWWRSGPAREGPVHTRRESKLDAVIVGGGVIGLACAWRAARRGLRVRVLERDQPGDGASGVAAGMLAPVGEATWGEDELLGFALESHRRWPGFAAQLSDGAGTEAGFVEPGAVHVALDRDEAEALRRRFELMRSVDLEAEWLSAREVRALEPGLVPSASAGVHAPHESAADPRVLLAALRAAAEAAGAEVVASAEVVEAILDDGRLAGVRTADGAEHRAERTVLAAGAWSGDAAWLPPELRPPVRPVKGEILTLRGSASEPVCEHVVVTERVYIVPRPDGRLIVGATVLDRGFDTQVTAGGVYELLREAYRALPEVAELELAEATAGLRPGTPDNAPLIGPAELEGLLLATGHFRNGILLAPATAEAIAAMLADEEPEIDVGAFSAARFGAEAVAR